MICEGFRAVSSQTPADRGHSEITTDFNLKKVVVARELVKVLARLLQLARDESKLGVGRWNSPFV